MEKIKYFLILLLIFLLFWGSSINFSKEILRTETQQKDMNEYLNQTNNQPLFGILEIPKINLKQPIYPKDDPKNQVDKNITLLEEDVTQNVPNPVIILASHSGNGPYAYFKNLTSLKEGDAIFLWLKSEQKEYRLIKKEEVMKNETLYVKTFSFSHLILITCSKTNSKIQEIYYAKYISNK